MQLFHFELLSSPPLLLGLEHRHVWPGLPVRLVPPLVAEHPQVVGILGLPLATHHVYDLLDGPLLPEVVLSLELPL